MPKPESPDTGDMPQRQGAEAALNERFELQRELNRYNQELKRAREFVETANVAPSERDKAYARIASMEHKRAEKLDDIALIEEDLPDPKKLN